MTVLLSFFNAKLDKGSVSRYGLTCMISGLTTLGIICAYYNYRQVSIAKTLDSIQTVQAEPPDSFPQELLAWFKDIPNTFKFKQGSQSVYSAIALAAIITGTAVFLALEHSYGAIKLAKRNGLKALKNKQQQENTLYLATAARQQGELKIQQLESELENLTAQGQPLSRAKQQAQTHARLTLAKSQQVEKERQQVETALELAKEKSEQADRVKQQAQTSMRLTKEKSRQASLERQQVESALNLAIKKNNQATPEIQQIEAALNLAREQQQQAVEELHQAQNKARFAIAQSEEASLEKQQIESAVSLAQIKSEQALVDSQMAEAEARLAINNSRKLELEIQRLKGELATAQLNGEQETEAEQEAVDQAKIAQANLTQAMQKLRGVEQESSEMYSYLETEMTRLISSNSLLKAQVESLPKQNLEQNTADDINGDRLENNESQNLTAIQPEADVNQGTAPEEL